MAASTPLLIADIAPPSRPGASITGIAADTSGRTYTAASAASASTALIVAGGGVASAVNDVVGALARRQQPKGVSAESLSEYAKAEELTAQAQATSRAMVARRAPPKVPTPKWHAPWKLMRVIAGHLGWVRSLAVEPGNDWFATGSSDNTIKIWDLASGTLKLTLTGHISPVRALAVSGRHPYLFSGGEDKQVKCWDLETNTVVRQYHGHLSGVYAVALHPTLDVLATGGRDAVCRLWDVRTKAPIHTLGGHEHSVTSILCNSVDPQVVTAAMDATVRCWDLVAGKARVVLTHHKKAVRCLVNHPREFAMVSGSADHLKKWALPEGTFVHNYSGHNSIVNALAVNDDDVLVSAGDDGSLKFWDYGTGYSFQETQSRVQPGSLDSEAGIYTMAFDKSGRCVRGGGGVRGKLRGRRFCSLSAPQSLSTANLKICLSCRLPFAAALSRERQTRRSRSGARTPTRLQRAILSIWTLGPRMYGSTSAIRLDHEASLPPADVDVKK